MNDRCLEFREKIAALLAGDLPSTDVEAVERHVRECSDCRQHQLDLFEDDRLLNDFVRSVDDAVPRLEGQPSPEVEVEKQEAQPPPHHLCYR